MPKEDVGLFSWMVGGLCKFHPHFKGLGCKSPCSHSYPVSWDINLSCGRVEFSLWPWSRKKTNLMDLGWEILAGNEPCLIWCFFLLLLLEAYFSTSLPWGNPGASAKADSWQDCKWLSRSQDSKVSSTELHTCCLPSDSFVLIRLGAGE